jgi:phosphatidylglycerophosphatase A
MSKLRDRFDWLVATCCGFGYSPIFPGTAGALWGIVIFVPIGLYVDEPWQTVLLALALVVSCSETIRLGKWAERYFDEKDSGKFVTDEVAGFLLTVLLFRIRPGGETDVWLTVLWAFPVTRIIDIIKVPPARQLERLPGGWGVIADDLLGSLYAAALLHALQLLCPVWFL